MNASENNQLDNYKSEVQDNNKKKEVVLRRKAGYGIGLFLMKKNQYVK